MTKPSHITSMVLSVVVILGSFGILSSSMAAGDKKAINKHEEGKALAFNNKKGNCLACHAMDDGDMAGNIGPALVAMKLRFPDKTKIREQIVDSSINKADTIMPPFGVNEILTEEEIDKVVDYIYSL